MKLSDQEKSWIISGLEQVGADYEDGWAEVCEICEEGEWHWEDHVWQMPDGPSKGRVQVSDISDREFADRNAQLVVDVERLVLRLQKKWKMRPEVKT